MLNILMLLVLIAITVSLLKDGLWSNTITLFNVVTAALVATNYFEPVADLLTGFVPTMIHFWGILSVGLVFVAVYLLLRAITGKLSRFRVRFSPPVDNFGGIAVGAVTGWIVVCFLMFSLHIAPLSRVAFRGSFDPEQRMMFGLAPDRLWMAFVQKLTNDGAWGRNDVDEDGNITSMFDPKGDFMLKYASRRAWLDKEKINFE